MTDYVSLYPDVARQLAMGYRAILSEAATSLISVCDRHPEEVGVFRAALDAGQVDGMWFWDEDNQCGCLLGYIAKAQGAPNQIVDDRAVAIRIGLGGERCVPIPAEHLVAMVNLGQTPLTSNAAAVIAHVIDEWAAARALGGEGGQAS